MPSTRNLYVTGTLNLLARPPRLRQAPRPPDPTPTLGEIHRPDLRHQEAAMECPPTQRRHRRGRRRGGQAPSSYGSKHHALGL